MDIESLKAILAVVQGVSVDAKTIALVYIGMEFSKILLFWAFWLSAAWIGIPRLFKLIRDLNSMDDEDDKKRMNTQLRNRIYGVVTSNKMTYTEAKDLCEKLDCAL